MKNNINFTFSKYGLIAIVFSFYACSSSESDRYTPIEVSPVVLNLAEVPYANLSHYQFFKGEIKNQQRSYGVLPYKPASELFTDYALKSRFVYLPNGTKATYTNDADVLKLPVGSALIKTFYYNNVQPSNTTKIIETRVMIKVAEANEETNGWIFAEYLWNSDQTDAVLSTQASTVSISWIDQNNTTQSVDYKTPSTIDCKSCHDDNTGKSNPIGIKPQNLNNTFPYTSGAKNQLSKWIEFGYLEYNLPATIVSTVDYNDTSKSLDLRVRSYFDINCAHCHRDGGNVDFIELRMPFDKTSNPINMGVCKPASLLVPGITQGSVVKPGSPAESTLFYMMNTNQTNFRMPKNGRTIIHQEGIQLVSDWINSLPACN